MNKSGRVVPKFNIGITDYKNIMGTHYSPNCKEIMDLAKREGQFGECVSDFSLQYNSH